MDKDLNFKTHEPDKALSDFVERIWLFQNLSTENKELIAIPDGRIDLIFTRSPNEPFRSAILGIETIPSSHIFSANTLMFGISLNLLSVEYLLKTNIATLVNSMELLPNNYWDISEKDLTDFDNFSKKVSDKIASLVPLEIDSRKQTLFALLYSTNGSLTVKEYSEKAFWTSRQINRYFNQYFGLSLKAYCTILRFRASFSHLKDGKLYPELNFTDQAHFIKEVKKLSGVSPKELSKNQKDRFIQFSTLT
jgi:AraC-like DNA-binding protein